MAPALPALAARGDAPGARHAQVRMDREPALEAHHQVLAVRVDGADLAPRELLGPAILAEARMRRGDRLDLAVDQSRADAVRRSTDRVALGHTFKARRRAASGGRRRTSSGRLPSG